MSDNNIIFSIISHSLSLGPPEVVAAAGVDHGVHAAVDPAKPGQDGEGHVWVGDTVGTDA